MTPDLSRKLARLVQLLTFQQRRELIMSMGRNTLQSLDDLPDDIREIYESNKRQVDGPTAP